MGETVTCQYFVTFSGFELPNNRGVGLSHGKMPRTVLPLQKCDAKQLIC